MPTTPTRVAGYDLEQIANAAIIADVARAWGMGDRGALLGAMCAMGESSLRNIDYGDWETSGVRNPDGTPTTSIGLFQQQASWGSAPDRMDAVYAAWAFYNALRKVEGWQGMTPTLAIHRVQVNADPNHYAKYETPARAVLAAIPELRAKGAIMADPMEVIEVPWQPGMFGVRALIEALDRAGRPRINSMHRVYSEQKKAWDAYRAGRGNPADNPDDPNNFELGHVRGIAADIDVTPENVRRLSAAGLVRPFSWEGWHWRLPGDVRRFPLLFSLPTVASAGGVTPIEVPKEDSMAAAIRVKLGENYVYFNIEKQFLKHCGWIGESDIVRQVFSPTDELHTLDVTQFRNLLNGLGIPQDVVNFATGAVKNPQANGNKGAFEPGGVWSREREMLAALAR